MKRAKIIVIEGTDGSGKETQSKKIKEYYISKGLNVKSFSFPKYDSPTGKIVGGAYLGKPEISESVFPETSANVDPLVSSLYYAADRRYNFLKFIEEEIYQNDIIILDRYTTSSLIYQSSVINDVKEREAFIDYVYDYEYHKLGIPEPDLVIFLHAPFEITRNLKDKRKDNDGIKNDIHERDLEFMKKVSDASIYIAKKYNWDFIECTDGTNMRSIEDIHNDVYNLVKKKIKK